MLTNNQPSPNGGMFLDTKELKSRASTTMDSQYPTSKTKHKPSKLIDFKNKRNKLSINLLKVAKEISESNKRIQLLRSTNNLKEFKRHRIQSAIEQDCLPVINYSQSYVEGPRSKAVNTRRIFKQNITSKTNLLKLAKESSLWRSQSTYLPSNQPRVVNVEVENS